MQAMVTAISAFSARGARGRRGVLLAFSALLALGILVVSNQLAARAAEEALERAQRPETYEPMSANEPPIPVPPPLGTLAIADVIAMLLLGGGLFVVAPAMAAAQVGEERRSGTLDLLRTAPLSPNQLVAGFLVGAPTSLYLLLAGPFALHLAAGIAGSVPQNLVATSVLLLGFGSMFMMLLSVLAALSIGREAPGGAASLGIAGVMGLFALVTLGLAAEPFSASWAHIHPAGAMSVLYRSFEGPYRETMTSAWNAERLAQYSAMSSIEPIFASCIYAAASAFLLVATRRALAGDTPSRLSKLEAIGLFSVATIAILVPMRIVVVPADMEIGNLAALALGLVLPFMACVLGATPSATAYGAGRARGLSAKSAPLLSAVFMLALAAGLFAAMYGHRALGIFRRSQDVTLMLSFAALALTLPIYSLFASTRLATPSVRLAFWALVLVHLVLQLPALTIFITDHTTNAVTDLLAKVGVIVGVVFPCVVAWRQRVADRGLAARAV